jgi:hypothetical protein
MVARYSNLAISMQRYLVNFVELTVFMFLATALLIAFWSP